jgi:putative resolvase
MRITHDVGEFLTPPQLARMLGITATTVREWRRRGYIHAHRLPNGRYAIPSSEIERLTGDPTGPARGEA